MTKFYTPTKDTCTHVVPDRTEAVLKSYKKPGGDTVMYCTKCFTEADIDNMDVSALPFDDVDDAKLKDGTADVEKILAKLDVKPKEIKNE